VFRVGNGNGERVAENGFGLVESYAVLLAISLILVPESRYGRLLHLAACFRQ
jgi:hypothetical protein